MRTLPLNARFWPALVSIQKASTTVAFTTHTRAITFGGVTYQPAPGADVTGMQFSSDGAASNADVVVMVQPGGIVEPNDGIKGALDDWPASLTLIDPTNPVSAFPIIIGSVG